MNKKRIAIVRSDFHDKHSSSWGNEWIKYCEDNFYEFSLVDWRSLESFDELVAHDIVLWHFSHYSQEEMLFARSILQALKLAGCRVFPDLNDSLHFDDKVAQAYFFKSLGIQSPKNYPIHSKDSLEDWIKTVGIFPVVAKLRTGSGSANVKLINNINELRKYGNQMFDDGVNSTPSLYFKLKSNILSAKSFHDIYNRFKRVPEFLFSRKSASRLSKEIGYVYLQEYISDVNYDLKIAVVRDRLSFVARGTRPGEFRASGGGTLFYDKSLVDDSIIKCAFSAYDSLGSDCTGFDMIKDPKTNKPVILEVSYGFSHIAQIQANGYFDRNCNWHDEPLNPPYHLLDCIVKEL